MEPYPDDGASAPSADLLEQLPAAFVLLDPAWRVTFANASSEAVCSRTSRGNS